jgi:hypothetical protein
MNLKSSNIALLLQQALEVDYIENYLFLDVQIMHLDQSPLYSKEKNLEEVVYTKTPLQPGCYKL